MPPAAEPTRSADTKYTVELRLFASEANPPLFRTIQRTCTNKADYPMVARWNYIVSKRLRLTTAPVGEGLDELERLVATICATVQTNRPRPLSANSPARR